MDINFTKKYLDNLLIAVKKMMLEKFPDNDYRYYSMFFENENFKDRMAKDYQKKKFKFIIINSDKFTQTIKNGVIKKTQAYRIRVGTENQDQEKGYEEITDIANNIINFFTSKPLAMTKRDGYTYHVNLDTITGNLNEELTVGDYWVYEIFITLDLPV